MFRSFRSVLILIIVATAVIPVLLFAYPLVNRIHTITSEAAVQELHLRAESIAQSLNHEIDLITSRLVTLSVNNDVSMRASSSLFGGRAAYLMQQFLNENPLVASVYLLDISGLVAEAVPAGVEGLPPSPLEPQIQGLFQKSVESLSVQQVLVAFEGKAFLQQTAFLLAKANGEQLTEKEIGSESLALLVPLLTGRHQAQWRGMLVAIIPLDHVIAYARAQVKPPTVLDFLKQEQSLLLHENLELETQRMIASDVLLEFKTTMLDQDIQYLIRLMEPYSVRFAHVDKTITQLVFAILGAVLLLLGFAYAVARWLVSPFKTLTDLINEYAMSNYQARPGKLLFLEFKRFVQLLQEMGSEILQNLANLANTNRSLAKANTRLAMLLEGTRQMTAVLEKFLIVARACHFILREIPVLPQVEVHLYFPEVDSDDVTFLYAQLKAEHYLRGWPAERQYEVHYQIPPALLSDLPESLQALTQLPPVPGCSLQGANLLIPIWQETQLLGIVEIRGVLQESFQEEDRGFVDTLTQSLAIALANINFTLALQEKVRMEAELKTAAAVQHALFPKALPQFSNLALASFFQSASETGGDWYGFMTEIEGYLFIMIGDVTGHGTPAALVTATASATCRTLEKMYAARQEPPGPAEVLTQLNQAVYETGYPNFLMTFFIARIDLETGALTFANAGHNFPILFRASGKLEHLLSHNSILGYSLETHFQEKTIRLGTGDFLVFYTDGLIENSNPKGDMWKERKLVQYLRKHLQLPPQAIVDGLVEELYQFYENHPLEDDMTVVMCHVKQPFLQSAEPSPMPAIPL